jgi:hypothetical protein
MNPQNVGWSGCRDSNPGPPLGNYPEGGRGRWDLVVKRVLAVQYLK